MTAGSHVRRPVHRPRHHLRPDLAAGRAAEPAGRRPTPARPRSTSTRCSAAAPGSGRTCTRRTATAPSGRSCGSVDPGGVHEDLSRGPERRRQLRGGARRPPQRREPDHRRPARRARAVLQPRARRPRRPRPAAPSRPRPPSARRPHHTAGRYLVARQITLWHYQWLLVHEHLPQICGQDLVDDVLRRGRPLLPPPAGRRVLPVEFGGAAYRFGHSMVRPSYRANFTSGGPRQRRPHGATRSSPWCSTRRADQRPGRPRPGRPARRLAGRRGATSAGRPSSTSATAQVKPNKRIDTTVSSVLFALPTSAIAPRGQTERAGAAAAQPAAAPHLGAALGPAAGPGDGRRRADRRRPGRHPRRVRALRHQHAALVLRARRGAGGGRRAVPRSGRRADRRRDAHRAAARRPDELPVGVPRVPAVPGHGPPAGQQPADHPRRRPVLHPRALPVPRRGGHARASTARTVAPARGAPVPAWICATCAVQQPDTDRPPRALPDLRGRAAVRRLAAASAGPRADELARDHRSELREEEPGPARRRRDSRRSRSASGRCWCGRRTATCCGTACRCSTTPRGSGSTRSAGIAAIAVSHPHFYAAARRPRRRLRRPDPAPGAPTGSGCSARRRGSSSSTTRCSRCPG